MPHPETHPAADRRDWCPYCLLLLAVGTEAADQLLKAGTTEREFLARLRQSREALDQGHLGHCRDPDCGQG